MRELPETEKYEKPDAEEITESQATLNKDECIAIVDFIESEIFTAIRENEGIDIDGVEWLCNLMSAYRKMKEVQDNG